jgi:hypothetical protein
MGDTFGIFTKGQKEVTFAHMKASLINGSEDPNLPTNPGSPNAPRVEGRIEGYPSPLLGDPGNGKIGRWSSIKMDSLEAMTDQMIEQYLRDKAWYGTVRCREALWNMFRRLEWWVKQQTDPMRSDYQRSLQMIRDCIYKILKDAEVEGGTHEGVSLPLCPAPYQFPYHGDYLNHFDARVVEVPMFDWSALPASNDFPGMFRYVSASEEQEWNLVHSAQTADESLGTENIMKLDVNRITFSSSSKITFNWKFRKLGYIKFKFLASVARGNGLLFFINGNQVGGEWSNSNVWQEVKFNVQPGQTFKFDWLVRRQTGDIFGSEAIYVKDIKTVETIRTSDSPTPPDFSVMGNNAYTIGGYDWITYSADSVVRTDFDGVVAEGTNGNAVRSLVYPLDNECDGTVAFSYRTGVRDPIVDTEWYLMFQDNNTDAYQVGNGHHGSSASAQYDTNWTMHGDNSSTTADLAVINYTINVADNTTVDISGSVTLVCPAYEIDHYDDTIVKTIGNSVWNFGGNIQWQYVGNNLVVNNPVAGYGSAYTDVNVPQGGWFTFSCYHQLRNTEKLYIYANGEVVFQSAGAANMSNVRINLPQGSYAIEFRIVDSYTEQNYYNTTTGVFTYGAWSQGSSYNLQGAYGSTARVSRFWDTSNDGASTTQNGDTISYAFTLRPGATATLSEQVKLFASYNRGTQQLAFTENFNIAGGAHSTNLSFSPNWEWEDIYHRFHPAGHGDGVYKVENKPGSTNTITLFHGALLRGGTLSFEYGGIFNTYESLKVYADSTLIWNDAVSSFTELGTTVSLTVPAGTAQIQWVYQDLSGTTVTIPPTGGTSGGTTGGGGGGTPSNPYGEVCYLPSSQQSYIDYNSASGEILTDRGADFAWKGNVYTSATLHAVETDEIVVTRDLYTQSFGSSTFHETLKIYAGNTSPTNLPTPVTDTGFNLTRGKQSYLNLDVLNASPPSSTGAFVAPNMYKSAVFHTEGYISLYFDYLAYIVDENESSLLDVPSNKNISGWKAKHRAIAKVYLVPYDGNEVIDPTIPTGILLGQYQENQGNRQRLSSIDFDVSDTGKLKIIKTVASGNYRLVFTIQDTVADTDVDAQGFPYYFAVSNIGINVMNLVTASNAHDGTSVTVELVNKLTGSVVQSREYNTNGNAEFDYSIYFSIPSPGTAYQVRYTFHKGEGVSGGLYNRGGAMALTQGIFGEYWSSYCKDNNGNIYRQGSSPNPPPISGGGGTGTTVNVPPSQSYCWVDTFKFMENQGIQCTGSKVVAQIISNQTVIETHDYTSTTGETINLSVTNTTDQVNDFYITLTLVSSCESPMAKVWGGTLSIEDILQPLPSYVVVTDLRVTNRNPIYMGGCNNSNIKVTVYNENNDVVMATQTYTAETIGSFSVTELAHLPYSIYRVEVITHQNGQISNVTGRNYLTTFKLLDFKAFERYQNVPAPYNAKLEFFVDDSLKGTYTTTGGFYTESFAVPKGKHQLRWVFTELGTGSVYDFCEIDFITMTNWICDSIKVTPYCQQGGGDKCVEALIRCALEIINNRPKACVIGKKIWLFT